MIAVLRGRRSLHRLSGGRPDEAQAARSCRGIIGVFGVRAALADNEDKRVSAIVHVRKAREKRMFDCGAGMGWICGRGREVAMATERPVSIIYARQTWVEVHRVVAAPVDS